MHNLDNLEDYSVIKDEEVDKKGHADSKKKE